MFRFFNLNNFKYLKYLPNYLFDSDVSIVEKAEIIAVIIYIISPFDLIPEFLIGFGFADDFVILGLLLQRIANRLQRYEIKNHYKEYGDDVIFDINYRVNEDEEDDEKDNKED